MGKNMGEHTKPGELRQYGYGTAIKVRLKANLL